MPRGTEAQRKRRQAKREKRKESNDEYDENYDEFDMSKQKDKVIEYSKTHNYPDYKMIREMINSDVNTDAQTKLIFLSEYGKFQHEKCKDICENPFNTDLQRDRATDINRIGGFHTLQACFYIMCRYSQYRNSEEFIIKIYPSSFNNLFDGIGEWIA